MNSDNILRLIKTKQPKAWQEFLKTSNKKITIEEREVKSDPDEKQDPFNSPISKTLIERADERRQKMKAFNYKFNSSKIEEIEKEPAYKRQGISLSDIEHSSDSHTSRTTIGLDDNDEVLEKSS